MNQKAFFQNIEGEIINHLSNANFSIYVAVAWITSIKLLNALEVAVNRGVNVRLIFFEDKVNNKDLFKNLYYGGGQLYRSSKLMHNKFCVIDQNILINGSYNWTANAKSNNENVLISYDAFDLASSYIEEFEKLVANCQTLDKYYKYSTHELNNLVSNFEQSFAKVSKFITPYFFKVSIDSISKRGIQTGFYLITNAIESYNLHWELYLLEKKYEVNSVNNLLKRKYTLAQHFDFVNLPFSTSPLSEFASDKYRVERKVKHVNEVFYVDKKGNLLGDKLWFTEKTNNGLYLQLSPNINNVVRVINSSFESQEFNISFARFYENIGIVGFGNKYSEINQSQYGIIDLKGRQVINFQYDKYCVNEENSFIEMIEYPLFQINNDNDSFKELNLSWEYYSKHPHKITTIDFGKIGRNPIETTSLIIPEGTNVENYIFRSEEDYKFEAMYVLLASPVFNTRFKFLNRYDIKYSSLKRFKQIAKEKNNAIYPLMLEDKILESRDFDDRIYKRGKYTEKKEGCYIATSVYESYDHENVKILRSYRDNVLLKTWIGKSFVQVYYLGSPFLVKKFGNNQTLKILLKIYLDWLTMRVKLTTYQNQEHNTSANST